MNATLRPLPPVEAVDPAETSILVRLNPASLSDETLRLLQLTAEPRNTEGDALREWLRGAVLSEVGRRIANGDPASDVPLECAGWSLPWHTFDDAQLAAALAVSFSWCGLDVDVETSAVFGHVHHAVVVACATRLQELHAAIERSRRRKG